MMNQINHFAQMWFDWQVSMFWQVAILIAIIACVDFLIKKWAWPQVRYALWLLILVKLILPPSLTSPASFTDEIPLALQHAAVKINQQKISPPVIETVPINIVTNSKPFEISPQIENALHDGGDITGEETEAANIKEDIIISWKVYALCVWVFGAIVLTVWLVLRLRNLRHQHLKTNGQIPAKFLEILGSVAKKYNLRTLPRIILTNKVSCPAVFGIFKPVLLMPAKNFENISPQQAEHIFLHELAHIKRGDLIVHGIYMILQIAYWFNPFLWVIRRHLQNLRELCCDATVARILREQTADYRQTLLETAKRLIAEPVDPGLGLLGLFENSSRLIDRLRWLEKKTWKYRPLRIATVFILICIMSACVLPMAKDKAAEGPENTDVNDFSIKLSNGTTVELVGVCEHPSKGKQWWQPNGELLNYEIETLDRSKYESKEPGYEFVIKVSGDVEEIKIGEIEHSEQSSDIAVLSPSDSMLARRSHIKSGVNKTEITIAYIPNKDKWETIAEHNGQGTTFRKYKDNTIIFSQANDTAQGTVITLTDNFKDNQASRLIAVTKDGKQIRCQYQTSLMVNGMRQQGFLIKDTTTANIKNYKFQQAAYEHVTFKNVSLKSGFKTDVEVGKEVINSQEVYPIDFEITRQAFLPGDSIEITQISGSKDKFEPNQTYTIKGKYTLSSHDDAMLHIYATNGEITSQQGPVIKSGSGDFERTFIYEKQGWLHLSFYPAKGGSSFGNLYFAQKGSEEKVPDFSAITSKVGTSNYSSGDSHDVDVYIEDFNIYPYDVGELYRLTVKIGNKGAATSPAFRMNFYKGDPKYNLNLFDKPQSGNHGAGPIKPGEFWNECSQPFAINEGENYFSAVLDTENNIAESNENNNQAILFVKAENGKIIKKFVSPSASIEYLPDKTVIEARNAKAIDANGGVYFEKVKVSIGEPCDVNELSKPVTDANESLNQMFKLIGEITSQSIELQKLKMKNAPHSEIENLEKDIEQKNSQLQQLGAQLGEDAQVTGAMLAEKILSKLQEYIQNNSLPLSEKVQEQIQDALKKTQQAIDANQTYSDSQTTPLHLAVMNNHQETAETLISRGADVNAKDSQGSTPLHLAASNGSPDMCRFLIEKGADVNVKNNNGRTSLDLAAANGHRQTVDLLLEKGAAISPPPKPSVIYDEEMGKNLPDDLRAFDKWSFRTFSEFLDCRQFTTSYDEETLISQLNNRKSKEYYRAINILACIKSQKAVPSLAAIAFTKQEKDNRDRWMAARALGIIGDKSVTGDLIHLMYHPNNNTRLYARVSLIRLTGKDLGPNWEKWASWYKKKIDKDFSTKKIKWTDNKEWSDVKKQRKKDEDWLKKLQDEQQIKQKYRK
ncbi:MAG: hypothetical protein A2Y12_03010 [Planctomycetes bacterium GWF2_42_9]|nr:MAG: hypothetical protein A2Y12_03010 [Planctomycetes bacterium GWF2_42_9]